MKMTRVALGFRAHSGWAAMVAVSGPNDAPAVIDRRRVELAALEIARPVQPYHAAVELDLKEARDYVKHATDEAKLWAKQALRAAIADLHGLGCEVVACGIIVGSGRPAATLEATLASHPLLHTAEGQLFRDALIAAGKHCRLPVLGVKEKEIYARGAAELGISIEDLKTLLTNWGRGIGPLWTQDQKLAALVARLALRALA